MRIAKWIFKMRNNFVISNAETTSVREISLPEESAPPVYQWLIPALLVALFSAVKVIDLNNYL